MTTMGAEAPRAYFELINGERYDELAELFATDAELTAPGTAPRQGRAEIRDFYGRVFTGWPVHVDQPTRFVDAGPTWVVEVHFSGRRESGDEFEFDAVDVFDLDQHGQIARLSNWYDSYRVREMVGRAVR